MQSLNSSKKTSELLEKLSTKYPIKAKLPIAIINIDEQRLYVYLNAELINDYPVSSSRFGVGQVENSYKTPLGIHCIKEKIGANAEIGEVFIGRQRTHNLAIIEDQKLSTNQDCITSRIIWLDGLEKGVNKGNGVDSYTRYIYIHGTHEEGLIGQPASQGCIRMKNKDVISLFDTLEVSSLVVIIE